MNKDQIVTTRAENLKEAVSASRAPFLLLISFTFLWLTAMYEHDAAMDGVLIQRFEQQLLQEDPCAGPEVIPRYHPNLTRGDSAAHGANDTQAQQRVHDACAAATRAELNQLYSMRVAHWAVALPGVGAITTVYDLGIVGNAVLILLLVWFLFASRREEHAIRVFVNNSADSDGTFVHPLGRFTLHARDPDLTCRDYLLAHEAVAQRFVFLTSRMNILAFLLTLLLVALPLLVSGYNSATDFRDIWKYGLGDVGWRGWVGAFGFATVALLDLLCALRVLCTQALLHAWYQAVRGPWRLPKRADSPAPAVQYTPFAEMTLAPSPPNRAAP